MRRRERASFFLAAFVLYEVRMEREGKHNRPWLGEAAAATERERICPFFVLLLRTIIGTGRERKGGIGYSGGSQSRESFL